MISRRKLAQTFCVLTLGCGTPFIAFGASSTTCDGCSILITIESMLQTISDNVTAIKNVLVTSADSASQTYGDFISTYSATDSFTQASDTLTKSQSDALMKQFQGGNDADSNVEDAYYNLTTNSFGIYSSLSAYSLLGTGAYTDPLTGATTPVYAYSSDQQKAADMYIRFLSGNAMPLTQPSSSSSTDGKKQVNVYRTLSAVQSLNAYNLSALYADRYPIQTPSSLKSIFNSSYVSSQSLVEYIQQEKVTNSDWLKGIATASPTDLSRDTVYLLAGVFGALYRMEQNQERLLASQTANNTLLLLSINMMNDIMNQSTQQIQDLQGNTEVPDTDTSNDATSTQ